MAPTPPRKLAAKPFEQTWSEDMIRALWLGLGGRTAELENYLRRILPKWESESPEFTKSIRGLLEQMPSQGGAPVRRAIPPAELPRGESGTHITPIASRDPNSGEELLRFESPVVLPVEPVWPASVNEELIAIIRERRAVASLAAVGLRPTHTVIFTGIPGVGKTLAARWIARELGLPLAVLNLGSVMSSFLGRTGANLRQVIASASQQPCVLLLDELDAIAKRRDDNSDIGELKRLVTVLLQELDNWPPEGLLIAATNHENLIDPAVWRRFERRVPFPLPQAGQQAKLLGQLLDGEWTNLDPKTKLGISTAATRLSPADVTQISLRTKRDLVLTPGDFESKLMTNLSGAISTLPLAERRRVGADLKRIKIGQREINRLTGLARETIRSI